LKRYEELDSLRGLASLSVVFHHCLMVFPIFLAANFHQLGNFWLPSNSPLHLFWAGHEAVILFFVLSGFVLSLPFLNNRAPKYPVYMVRRICRIYIPYIFSILVSVTLFILIKKTFVAELTDWFRGMWSADPFNTQTIMSFLFMFGKNTHNLNTVTWSLVHEMRISLVFPLIIIPIIKWNWKKSIIIGLSTLLCFMLFFLKLSRVYMYDENLSFLLKTISDTFYFGSFFIIGAIFAKYRAPIKSYVESLEWKTRIAFSGFGLFLYLSEWLIPGIGFLKYNGSTLETTVATTALDMGIALSILILFSFAVSSFKLQSLLKNRLLLYLGKISYSLYLIHPIVLLTFVYLMNGILPMGTLIIFVPVISVLLAGVMYKLIEKPSMAFGKRLTKNTVSPKEVENVA
jgi:peptidoglycan/LPS O-acetylase OafA/YrhL